MYTDHDRGLLTFLRRSNGEDWRLEEVKIKIKMMEYDIEGTHNFKVITLF